MISPVILQLAANPRVAQKAAHMSEIDSHGSTLTLVSVSVVFGALIILYIAYSISGKLFTRQKKSSAPAAISSSKPDIVTNEEEIAAAIAIALYEEELSLAASQPEGIHDYESGIITIIR